MDFEGLQMRQVSLDDLIETVPTSEGKLIRAKKWVDTVPKQATYPVMFQEPLGFSPSGPAPFGMGEMTPWVNTRVPPLSAGCSCEGPHYREGCSTCSPSCGCCVWRTEQEYQQSLQLKGFGPVFRNVEMNESSKKSVAGHYYGLRIEEELKIFGLDNEFDIEMANKFDGTSRLGNLIALFYSPKIYDMQFVDLGNLVFDPSTLSNCGKYQFVDLSKSSLDTYLANCSKLNEVWDFFGLTGHTEEEPLTRASSQVPAPMEEGDLSSSYVSYTADAGRESYQLFQERACIFYNHHLGRANIIKGVSQEGTEEVVRILTEVEYIDTIDLRLTGDSELLQHHLNTLEKDVEGIKKYVADWKLRQTKLTSDDLVAYLSRTYITSDNIEHRVKFSTLVEDISANLSISQEEVAGVKNKLPFIMHEMGLQKKRYADGMYWYGLERRTPLPEPAPKVDDVTDRYAQEILNRGYEFSNPPPEEPFSDPEWIDSDPQ